MVGTLPREAQVEGYRGNLELWKETEEVVTDFEDWGAPGRESPQLWKFSSSRRLWLHLAGNLFSPGGGWEAPLCGQLMRAGVHRRRKER